MPFESEPTGPHPEQSGAIESIRAIEHTRNVLISSRDEIKRYVEAPLVEACEDLYDKNVQTLASSCNAGDIERGYAYIIVNYDTLSPENQTIAETLASPEPYDDMRAVKLEIPLTSNSTVEEVSAAALALAAHFEKQPLTWVPTYTFEEVKAAYGIPADQTDVQPENFTTTPDGELLFYWDPESQRFYPSAEMHQKITGEK